MKTLYKIFRTIVLLAIGIALVVPPALFVALELDCVQRPVRDRAQAELSRLLGVDVAIGSVSIAPFNRATLRDITLSSPNAAPDASADTIATIGRLGAGIDLYSLLIRRELIVGYVELIGLDLTVRRPSPSEPTNLQPIIDALSPKEPNRKPTDFDLAINTVVIRRSAASYDVASAPRDSSGRFDPAHLAVTDLSADIRLPRLSRNDFDIRLNRLALTERSGFTLKSLSARVNIDSLNAYVIDPTIELAHSRLALSTVKIPVGGSTVDRLSAEPFNVALLAGSHINPSDLAPFVPALAALDVDFSLEADIEGTLAALTLNRLSVEAENPAMLSLLIANLRATDLRHPRSESFRLSTDHIALGCNGPILASTLDRLLAGRISEKALTLIGNTGNINFMGDLEATARQIDADGALTTTPGTIDLGASAILDDEGPGALHASASSKGFDLSALLEGVIAGGKGPRPGMAVFDAVADLTLRRGKPAAGNAALTVESVTLADRVITDINAEAILENPDRLTAALRIADPTLSASIDLATERTPDGLTPSELEFAITDADLSPLIPAFAGRRLWLSGHGSADSFRPNTLRADLTVDSLVVRTPEAAMNLGRIIASVDGSASPKRIDLSSRVADLRVRGNYDFHTLIPELRRSVAQVFPALLPAYAPLPAADANADADPEPPGGTNDFELALNIKTTEPIEQIMRLPVAVIYPVTFTARVATAWPFIGLELDAPYLQKGNKLIEGTHLNALIDATHGGRAEADVDFASTFPVKSGMVNLEGSLRGAADRLDSRIGWRMDREREFSGDINFSTLFSRVIPEGTDEAAATSPSIRRAAATRRRATPRNFGQLAATVHFNPGQAVFNDTAWTIRPSDITYSDRRLCVDNFRVSRPGQLISIDGTASDSPDDSLHLALTDINLDYVFETLGISNAMFGGRATGNFYAASLFTPSPRLYTDDLSVEGIKYNYCLMGDAAVRSHWDAAEKAVVIHADITGSHDNVSVIDGMIKPMSEELDFRFHADDVPVGFMLPFMSAFTSAIDGHASGDAHLYGTFKLLDMTGDLFARNFRLKVDFTNCWYETTDSIKLRPGRIDIPGVTIRDPRGNTARLDGWVTHKCFKEPRFDFRVTDALRLLVYNVGPTPDAIWYGTVFGNGSARIQGVPGRIDIGCNMSTAPGSSFTFVLSDAQQASEYNFITFRDRGASAVPDSLLATAPLTEEELIEELKKQIAAKHDADDNPSLYAMDITVDVNDNTLVTLVMDPVGGDRIRARGNGTLRMVYNSREDDLKMYGRYTLSEGNYNFTLQDIIIKDFTILRGSRINFIGNPYAPTLDVKAVYQLNANLSDLDESFLQDKELSRTNVPIQALMMVTGDIRQPGIAFDLRFPTLTDDVYRKVKSIISTDDMMNRQIIYLLALNRFYTPDYMSATKGNELVSVASSTISSQLSNILGQLSDNWTIAPNFRSDRGDFSDVEFDLALSSRLLNNRLLFNGNLGYRDKSLNNNSFIGDFDIEYILNRSGSIRLKAYNRYNDRNFYVKSALTTQGVGLLYRRDFDDMFRFLRPRRKPASLPADTATTDTATADTLPPPAAPAAE